MVESGVVVAEMVMTNGSYFLSLLFRRPEWLGSGWRCSQWVFGLGDGSPLVWFEQLVIMVVSSQRWSMAVNTTNLVRPELTQSGNDLDVSLERYNITSCVLQIY